MRVVGVFVFAIAVPQLAWAGGIDEISVSNFPPLPCSDGWSGCVVDDAELSPQMMEDDVGRPHAADMRFGFFDFKPLPAASPFVSLSEYSSPPMNQPVREQTREKRAEKGAEGVAKAENNSAREDRKVSRETAQELDAVSQERETTTLERDELEVAVMSEPVDEIPMAVEAPERAVESQAPEIEVEEPDGVAGASDGSPYGQTPDANVAMMPRSEVPDEASQVAEEPEGPDERGAGEAPASEARQAEEVGDDDAVAMAAPQAEGISSVESCDDLVPLQAPAMVGQLGVGRRTCLENRLSNAGTQTDKDKISRVLIIDAEYRGDRADWERLVKRHLNEISRSDPDLCLAYAHYLSSTKRYTSVIKWSEYALENKQKWSGNSYVKKVNSLYKIRAMAAYGLWERAVKVLVGERNPVNEKTEERTRGNAMNFSKEWLDYARAANQSTADALSLCVSAAHHQDFCQ